MLGIDERPGKEKSRKSKKSSSSKKRRKEPGADSDDDDDDDDDAARRTLRKDRMVPSHPITDVCEPLLSVFACGVNRLITVRPSRNIRPSSVAEYNTNSSYFFRHSA